VPPRSRIVVVRVLIAAGGRGRTRMRSGSAALWNRIRIVPGAGGDVTATANNANKKVALRRATKLVGSALLFIIGSLFPAGASDGLRPETILDASRSV